MNMVDAQGEGAYSRGIPTSVLPGLHGSKFPSSTKLGSQVTTYRFRVHVISRAFPPASRVVGS